MKKIFVILLSALLVLSLSSGAMSASRSLAPTGDKVVFTDENWAYEKNQGYGYELDEYIGTATEVEMPWSFAKEYITAVGDYAFNNNADVTSVTTTLVIEKFGDFAFNNCSALQSIELFDALSTIGVGCFNKNTSLTEINLEDTSITAVSDYCFVECGLSEIKLPDTCLSIGKMAFYKCSDLSKITIPRSVTTIDDTAFSSCENLTIYCYTDSYAHQYAVEKDIPFVLIDAPVEVTFIMGDADGDGYISVLDATKVQRVLASLDEDPDGMIALRAADGEVLNIMHATAIQRYLADYDVKEPIGEEVTRTVTV